MMQRWNFERQEWEDLTPTCSCERCDLEEYHRNVIGLLCKKAKALAAWLKSDDGQRCSAPTAPSGRYLPPRLQVAFYAGYDAAGDVNTGGIMWKTLHHQAFKEWMRVKDERDRVRMRLEALERAVYSIANVAQLAPDIGMLKVCNDAFTVCRVRLRAKLSDDPTEPIALESTESETPQAIQAEKET